jgi:hypothetical protein
VRELSAISYQLSAISYQLSAISYQLSAISYQLSAISQEVDRPASREAIQRAVRIASVIQAVAARLDGAASPAAQGSYQPSAKGPMLLTADS